MTLSLQNFFTSVTDIPKLSLCNVFTDGLTHHPHESWSKWYVLTFVSILVKALIDSIIAKSHFQLKTDLLLGAGKSFLKN